MAGLSRLSPRRIAVTGASGYVGARLIERLRSEDQVEGILALDIRPPPRPSDPRIQYLHLDVSEPFPDVFASQGIDAVVHLAYVLRPGRNREAVRRVNVGGTANVLEACAAAGVRRIVYLSSTSVYGAHPDNPPMLTEESPVRPVKGFWYSEDKAASESLMDAYVRDRPEVSDTILRACPVLGPTADNFIARAFLRPFLVAVRGYDPPMQFLHEDDLTEVLAQCALGEARGLYNVAGEGLIRWSEMAAKLGRRLVALPPPLLYAVTEAAWRLRLQSDSPSAGLDLIRHRWTASTAKIVREMGVAFRNSSADTVEAFANSSVRAGPPPRHAA